MADANLWQTLVNAALVGTERQPNAPLQGGGAIGEFLAQLPASGAEAHRLGQVATLALYRKAGKRAVRLSTQLTNTCAVDDLAVCPSPAVPYLLRMFNGEMSPILPECLQLIAQAGWRVPPRLLPSLLDMGSQRSALRALILPVLGQRGVWLAAQNSNWAYAIATSDIAVWETGTRQERLQYLRQMRQRNPVLAREQLAAAIAQEAAKDRVAFLQILDTGLSQEDLPFIESMLDDRSQEVRQIAVDLLLQLPNSSICQQALVELQALVQVEHPAKGTPKIALSLPSSVSPKLQQAGIDRPLNIAKKLGKSATQLARLISFVPLDSWPQQFAVEVSKLLNAIAQHQWRDAIMAGLILATLNQRNPAVAAVLLLRGVDQAKNLFNLLDAAAANRVIKQLHNQGEDERLWSLLQDSHFAWDATVTDIAIGLIEQKITAKKVDWSIGHWLAGDLASCVDLQATAAIQRLEHLTSPEPYVQQQMERCCQMLQFRQAVISALQPESG
jgi:hypothetical protein